MARGLPALWSGLVSIPFLGTAWWVWFRQEQFPNETAIPFLLFSLFIILTGLYIHFVASPSQPRLRNDEEVLELRHPTQRVALVQVGLGMPLLVATIYLLFFTFSPYVYPTLTLIPGLYFLSAGLHTYWKNTLTSYYVTTYRVLKEYRFLSLIRQEVPNDKIRGVQERKSVFEALVGLGNVRVASGGGRTLEIRMQNMDQPEAFAETIREIT